MAKHLNLGEGQGKPQAYSPKPDRSLWLDWETGHGLDDDGRLIEPIMDSRRKKVRLADLLETARRFDMDRIMVCGKEPQGWAWLVPAPNMGEGPEAWEKFLPGWEDAGSNHDDPARGRFRHSETGHHVHVQLASEWITRQCSPGQALWTYQRVTEVMQTAIGRDWALMRNPAATGMNLWKLRVGASSYGMEAMDPTIGALIQATDPQHRIESFTAEMRCGCGDCIPLITTAELEGFTYADGRFMFHAIPKDLGAAPARMLTAQEATDLQAADPFHPARYRVRVTINEFWDSVGPFPVQREEGFGWHYPNRPGCTFETWVDSAELRAALPSGAIGRLEILEGIALTKCRPMDPYVNLITKMLDLTGKLVEAGQPVSPVGQAAVASVIKHMYRASIGYMSRRPRLHATSVTDPNLIPDGALEIKHVGNLWTFKTPHHFNSRDWETWHPEIAARVWGASRARMLDTPVAKSLLDATSGTSKTKAKFGLFQIDPDQLIAIQGDAIYTTRPLRWTLPERLGGGDDGADGRIRIKGYLPGPIAAPHDRVERQLLSDKSEREGWEGRF